MKTIQVTVRDKLAVVALDRGRSNPMNAEMIAELMMVFKHFEDDPEVEGVVITGKEKFFSAGVDLIEVYNYNVEQAKDFWSKFMELQLILVSFSKPLVAAISGHSPAGGCIIAMCCDYRVMARGEYLIGLNEIPVGIIVPDTVFYLYAFWLGRRQAYQYLLEGRLLTVEEAYNADLVDAIVDYPKLMQVAESKVRSYMKLNKTTWQQSKLNFRRELIDQMETDHTMALNDMLHQWWQPGTRKILQDAIEKLTASARSK